MLVFVLNKNGKPLMPTKPAKARKLLTSGKAKVIRKTPFTIKLRHGSSGYVQPVTAGMDTGSKTIGCAATANGQVLYQSEVQLRQDVSKKMQQRAMYQGIRSEKRIPTGKTLGLRKHDYIKTPQGTGFVKGKRSSGYFALETILGEKVHASANIKKNTVRLSARTTTLIQPLEAAIPLGTKVPSILAEF